MVFSYHCNAMYDIISLTGDGRSSKKVGWLGSRVTWSPIIFRDLTGRISNKIEVTISCKSCKSTPYIVSIAIFDFYVKQ